jgi:subtilase family serine protease
MAVDQQAAQRFVDAASTPGSPGYHRFLSPGAYTRRFGASAVQVKAVESYLVGAGFTRVQTSVNDVYVSAIAPASIGSSVTVPRSISRDVLGITGLNGTQLDGDDTADDTAASPASSSASAKAPGCSRYWAQETETISPAFRGLTKATVAVCGYSAAQVRAGYGLTPANTGKGKTIALIEVGAPDDMFQTLTDYAKANGLPAPRADQYHEEAIGQGGKNSGGCVNASLDEAAIDSEAAYAMAPGASQLMVDGDDCDTSDGGAEALFDAMLAPLTGNGSSASVSIESVSVGILYPSETSVPPSLLAIYHSIALRVTVVGGTTLGIGAHDQRLFETGWSTLFGERTGTGGPWHDEGVLLATGGGVSAVYSEPGYQKSVVPSSMARDKAGSPGRTVPDISADADPFSGMLFGLIVTEDGKTIPYGTFIGDGTSMSTPLVAGMVADAEQGQPANFGFLNPLLYSLAGTQAFHDIVPLSPSDPQVDRAFYTTGDTHIDNKFSPGFLVGVNDTPDLGTGQVTAPGYNTMTGLGTPNGSAFINGLRSGK